MKINITKRFLLSLCLMTLTLLCGENKAWAADVTLTTADYTWSAVNKQVSQTVSGVTFSFNGGTTKPTYYSDGLRTYENCTITISSDKEISKIVFTYTIKNSGNLTLEKTGTTGTTGKWDTTSKTWTGSSKSVSLTVGHSSGKNYGQVRITKIVVTLTDSDPAPTFSLTGGTYNGPKHVTITAPDGYTEGIAYTTDGSDPTTSDINYTSAGIDITTTTTLRAVAYDSKGNSSGEATAKYTITYNAPTFSLAGGTYYGDQSVSISVKDLGTGSILYTTNGDDPKTQGNAYTGAISLPVGTKNLTLKAVAKYGEGLFSDVTEATYDIQKKIPSFYQLVTSTDELTENSSYLIVCESESVAFGEINSSDKGTPQAVTITGNKIDLSAAGTGTPIEFTLEGNESSGYLLKNPTTGNYIIFPNTDKTNITELSTPTTLIISFNEDKSVVIKPNSTATRQILYHTKDINSNYYVFGYYASKNAGNSDYAKVYLYKKHVISDFTFSDTEDLTASIPETRLEDQTITLNRTVYPGWNTFCVPFTLTKEQLEEAYGKGAEAKYLSGVTTDPEGATLHFTPETDGDIEGGIKANKAYLLYLPGNVEKPQATFSGVTLEPAGQPDGLCPTTVSASNGDYTFQGILKPTKLTTDDTQYFLNNDGTNFVLPINNTNAMKATRAYITVPAASSTAQGRHYSFDFNGTTTGIDNVNISGLEDGAWYTISGIRVNRPAAKGVYIHNGRKVIVK